MSADFQDALDRLNLLKQKSSDINKDLRSLKNTENRLTSEKEQVENEFEDLLVQHAKTECRQLVTMMIKKLPQEICDMIYRYIYVEEKPILVGSDHFKRWTPPFAHEDEGGTESTGSQISGIDLASALAARMDAGAVYDHSSSPPDDVLMPTDHVLNPAYMGVGVAYEVSKLYYAENVFSICTIGNSMHSFLFSDAGTNFASSDDKQSTYVLGLLPADYIRNLQVRVKYEHFDFYKNYYLWGKFEREQDLLNGIYKDLESLTHSGLTEPRPQRNIEIIIMTGFAPGALRPNPTADVIRRLINIMEAIRNSVYTLKHDQSAHVNVLHHDEESFVFPKSLDYLFSLSQSEWEYEKQYLVKAKRVYSPLHYFVAPAREHAVEFGFAQSRMNSLLKRRWACNPDMRPNPDYSVSKSMYWPRGRSSFEDRKEMRLSFSTDESS